MKKVLVIDTSVLCVWLKVPGKETCLKAYEPTVEIPRRRRK